MAPWEAPPSGCRSVLGFSWQCCHMALGAAATTGQALSSAWPSRQELHPGAQVQGAAGLPCPARARLCRLQLSSFPLQQPIHCYMLTEHVRTMVAGADVCIQVESKEGGAMPQGGCKVLVALSCHQS